MAGLAIHAEDYDSVRTSTSRLMSPLYESAYYWTPAAVVLGAQTRPAVLETPAVGQEEVRIAVRIMREKRAVGDKTMLGSVHVFLDHGTCRG